MQILERLESTPEAAWYRLSGDWQGRVERYVVSTPWSRAICNRPEVLGVEYTTGLGDCVAAALRTAPFSDRIRHHPEHKVCVVNFLRGGLNFDIRRALHDAYGFNRHSSAFMSSQRKRVEGRWHVQENMYRKLDIPRDAIMLMGDVVATGVTMDNGLQVVAEHVWNIGSSLRNLVFFTIGCHKAEKILESMDTRLRQRFPGYESTILIYLEAKFRLVDSKTELRIGIPGTDLIRKQALMAPEFEASQYESFAWPLERCAIYDAGSRAFDIPTYVDDVLEYWTETARYASEGWTLAEALEDRWPDDRPESHDAFVLSHHARWKGVDEAFVEHLYQKHHDRWNGEPGRWIRTPEALTSVCVERIATIDALAGDA